MDLADKIKKASGEGGSMRASLDMEDSVTGGTGYSVPLQSTSSSLPSSFGEENHINVLAKSGTRLAVEHCQVIQ